MLAFRTSLTGVIVFGTTPVPPSVEGHGSLHAWLCTVGGILSIDRHSWRTPHSLFNIQHAHLGTTSTVAVSRTTLNWLPAATLIPKRCPNTVQMPRAVQLATQCLLWQSSALQAITIIPSMLPSIYLPDCPTDCLSTFIKGCGADYSSVQLLCIHEIFKQPLIKLVLYPRRRTNV